MGNNLFENFINYFIIRIFYLFKNHLRNFIFYNFINFEFIDYSFQNLNISNNSQYLNLQIYLILLILNLYHLILQLLYQDLHSARKQLMINYTLSNYHLESIYYFI